MGTKNNPGSFDAYEKAEPNEPMFVLLARDPQAPILVDLWAYIRQELGEHPDKLAEARQLARDMRIWYMQHRSDDT